MNDEIEIGAGRGDDDMLAAEYALGVLDAADRDAAARRIGTDPAFARLVSAWEERLSGMNHRFDEATPPRAVKDAIDMRLFGNAGTPATGGTLATIWDSMAFWRGLSVVAIAGAAALAVLVAVESPQAPVRGDRLVAALAPNDSEDQFVAFYDTANRELHIIQVAGERPSGRDYELWLIEGDNAPISLGLVGREDNLAATLDSSLENRIAEGVTLAVSLEPLGGAPGGAPTGPVVAAGAAKKI